MILKNATVHTGCGEILQNCDIRIENGKIAEIGTGLQGDEVMDLTGKQVFPGFIDAGGYMGTMDMAFPAKDYNENSSPSTPYLDIWHSIDPDEINRQELYKAGITSMVITPGNEGVIGGTCSVIKSYGHNLCDMTVKRNVALKGSVIDRVAAIFANKGGPMTRMAMVALLKNEIEKKEYSNDYRGRKAQEVMDAVRSGEMPFIISAETAAEMESVLHALSGYGLKIVFTLAHQAGKVAASLKAAHASVVFGEFTRESSMAIYDIDFKQIVDMAKSGVEVCLSMLAPDMVYGRESYWWTVAKLMKGGADDKMVLKMLGENPAKLYGVADRIGMIKPGLDADLVIYDGNPIKEVGARLLVTMINGTAVYSA